MSIQEAAEALEAALRTVDRLRVYTDPAAPVDPPGAIVGPPALSWDGLGPDPSSARFLVYVVVALSERAKQQLWELCPLVAAAVDTVPDAVVRTASPTVWNAGGQDLPAYEITVEMGLS